MAPYAVTWSPRSRENELPGQTIYMVLPSLDCRAPAEILDVWVSE